MIMDSEYGKIKEESMINHSKVASRFSPRETEDIPSYYGTHAWIRIDYLQTTKWQ
jgi:hypothetical protein